jgi:hypothetical protein
VKKIFFFSIFFQINDESWDNKIINVVGNCAKYGIFHLSGQLYTLSAQVQLVDQKQASPRKAADNSHFNSVKMC